MEVVLENSIFSTVLKGVTQITNEIRFKFDFDGLHARAVDYANVALVNVHIPHEAFEIYTIEEELTVGVDVARIYDILKLAKKKDTITLVVNEGRLNVKFGNITYSLTLIDPEAIRKEPKLPEIEYNAKVVMTADLFKQGIQNLKRVAGDELVFRTDETGFHIEAESDKGKGSFYLGDFDLIEFNREFAEVRLSVEYLDAFTKVATKGDPLTIKLADNMPAYFRFEPEGKAEIEYYLAPRIHQ